MQRILVVGGAGYVGSLLTRELVERGYTVRVLDSMYFGHDGIAPVVDRIEVVVRDMRDVPAEALADVDTVVNVGGLSNDPTADYNPAANREINTTASVDLARMCVEHGVPRYIFASSCSVYDRGLGNEFEDIVVDEAVAVNPRAAYSSSKYAAERQLLPMASSRFCVTALRKATLFGYSPRMRYDLVVNTFVKDALSAGVMTLHCGGEMWRPLADVCDAARAYVALIEADAMDVNAEVFNLVGRNYRVSEIALRVQRVLRELGVPTELRPDYAHQNVRSYRVGGEKLASAVGFRPSVVLEDSVREMVEAIRRDELTDFENPRYYNIRWMRMLEETRQVRWASGEVARDVTLLDGGRARGRSRRRVLVPSNTRDRHVARSA
jgi:nucleoside-diphosphate-sugar epimerase